MCDFGVSAITAGVASGIAASSAATAASAGAVAGATGLIAPGLASAAAAMGTATLLPGVTAGTAIAAGAGAASSVAGIGLAEGIGIASLVASLAAGGGSAGASAKQAKDQGTLINAAAKAEKRNVMAQVNQEAEAAAQKTFEVAAAALAGRGNAQAANIADRSVRAITRAVGFQEGTDRATLKRNQEIANEAASARLQGIDITKSSQKLQIGSPALIAGTGAASAIAGGLNAGSGAYQAFSKFRIPTDGPNLAFV